MRGDDSKELQLFDGAKLYPYGTGAERVCKTRLIENVKMNKLHALIQQNNPKLTNFDGVARENTKEHNPKCSQVPDHPYRILIIAGS